MLGKDTIAVTTRDTVGQILAANNSAAWVLNYAEWASKLRFLVCMKKAGTKRQPFLVAKISEIRLRQSDQAEKPARYSIEFHEFARLPDDQPLVDGTQNPVQYGTLDKFQIDLETLTFAPAPPKTLEYSYSEEAIFPDLTEGLSIEAAKRGLAVKFGISEDQIEITIKA